MKARPVRLWSIWADWVAMAASCHSRLPWFFGEKANFQIRGEAFNAPNRVNLGGINTSLTSATFGRVTSASNARVFAVTGRLSF